MIMAKAIKERILFLKGWLAGYKAARSNVAAVGYLMVTKELRELEGHTREENNKRKTKEA